MSKYVFFLSRGLEDPTRVTRAFQMAKAAHELGHDVNVFLADDAVALVQEGLIDNVVAPTGDEAASHYHYLISQNVPIYVCTPCAQARKLNEKNFSDPVRFAGAPKLFEIAEGASIFNF